MSVREETIPVELPTPRTGERRKLNENRTRIHRCNGTGVESSLRERTGADELATKEFENRRMKEIGRKKKKTEQIIGTEPRKENLKKN